MSDLPKRLRITASMIALGERIAWGSDTAIMEEAADMIEALSASVENHQLHMLGIACERDQLRATLDAQPQSAPAGERETIRAVFLRNGFTVKEGQTDLKPYVYAAAEELLSIARAALQRAQGAVPDVSAMARVLSDRSADACNIDRDDNWAMYGQEYIEDVQAMLAAAPAHPAERQEQEGLHVWRATTRFGETCHFGEASTARAWAGENGTVERVELTPVPELRVVERQDQEEAQRLREALEEIRHANMNGPVSESNAGCIKRIEQIAERALAASTGQEVGK